MFTRRASPPFLISVMIGVVALSGIAGISAVQAQSGDKFDGAVWSFNMTPKRPGPEPLRGQFRVSNNVLYQRSQPSRTAPYDKVIGKNFPNGKRTRVEMEDFRAADKNRSWHGGMKGKILLTMDRPGEWSGTFVDAEGRHWSFQCTRVQE
jgi:hypothetical protein